MEMWSQPIASDTVRLSIPMNNLLSLPQGASYNGKHGRANVKAYVKLNDGGEMPTIIVEASCDSLQQLCLRYESEARHFRQTCAYNNVHGTKRGAQSIAA